MMKNICCQDFAVFDLRTFGGWDTGGLCLPMLLVVLMVLVVTSFFGAKVFNL